MYEYSASLIRIVDADTLDLDVDLGLETYRRLRVRLAGLDAPERFTDLGREAIGWVTEILRAQYKLVIQTEKDKTEKYGRYLVWIYLLDQIDSNRVYKRENSINTAMIQTGHAVPYDGGKRT